MSSSSKEEKKETPMVKGSKKITFEYSDSLPSGYVFVPSDRMLIDDLRAKMSNQQHLLSDKYRYVNLYDYHPQQLSESYESGRENVWYFFIERDKTQGNRIRKAKDGYWRGLAAVDIAIKPYNKKGYKRFFVFHEGDTFDSGVKTDWVMQEYRIDHDLKMKGWTLCKIYKMTETHTRKRKREFTEEMFDDEGCDFDLLELKSYHILGDQAVDDMFHDRYFDYDSLEDDFFNILCDY